ncbi:MAG: hypothetical protein IH959_08730 [Chloroflexi bacterium]|nr:hypothetical protein [Chloroflexota bacterium]
MKNSNARRFKVLGLLALPLSALAVAVVVLGWGHSTTTQTEAQTGGMSLSLKSGDKACPPGDTADVCASVGGALVISISVDTLPKSDGYLTVQTFISHGNLTYKGANAEDDVTGTYDCGGLLVGNEGASNVSTSCSGGSITGLVPQDNTGQYVDHDFTCTTADDTVTVTLVGLGTAPAGGSGSGFVHSDGVTTTAASDSFVIHCLVQPTKVDEFPNSVAEITVNTPLGSDTITLTGPTTVEVDLSSIQEVNGKDRVLTELVAMELTGTSTLLGPVEVRLRDPSKHPFQRSFGEIEEQINSTPGLDIPAHGVGPLGFADSFFDVFFEIELLDPPPIIPLKMRLLHNDSAKRMTATISSQPPATGETYENSDPNAPPLNSEACTPADCNVAMPHDPANALVTVKEAFHQPDPPKTSATMSVTIDAVADKLCTGVKGVKPKIDDAAGVRIDVCVEINAVSAPGYSGWDVVLDYDDESWQVDQTQGPVIFGTCDFFSGGIKKELQGDGIRGHVSFGCQNDPAFPPKNVLGPIAAVTFISKKKGNEVPVQQDFILLPKGSIAPQGPFAITGSSVFCEDLPHKRGKHNCDNQTFEPASITVNPQKPRNVKLPALQNLFLTRQGVKIPPVQCVGPQGGNDAAAFTHQLSGPVTKPDPKGSGQPQQLGAFEFEVHYDATKVCVVLQPGPAAANMTCFVQDDVTKPVLEGVARIGCVTIGKTGFPDTTTPEGRHLADVLVRPQPDVYSQAIPNQGNGVVAQLLNQKCELADLQGHPIPLFSCEDADVTIRYLEGDVEPDCVVNTLDTQAIAFRWGAGKGGLLFLDRFNLEPFGAQADDDIDIKDLQVVYGRIGSTCAAPHPEQPPVNPKG